MQQDTNNNNKNIIKEGDPVIIYEDISTSQIVKMIESGKFHNKFGTFLHKDIIGKQYGSKISCKKGYVHVLKPSPSLITQSLPHRTQILYTVDISQVISRLNVKPGSIVCETGTGSGSLSSSFAWACRPGGHLFTYEFNQDRYEKVKVEFEIQGLNNVTVVWRDTCKDGFKPKTDETFKLPEVDSVFLDLPKPWEAIPHAHEVLKQGGRICCFSPCIEQVQKNCLELDKDGFLDIRTFEFVGRNYEKKKNPFKSLDSNLVNRKRQRKELDKDDPNEAKFKEAQDNLKQEGKVEEKPVEQPKVEKAEKAEEPEEKEQFYYTSGSQTAQGHTGYLTFAIKK